VGRIKAIRAHLRSFGCKAYAHIPDQKRSKLDSKTVECIFVGYSNDSKAYRLFNPATRSIVKSRDVIFDEKDKARDSVEVGVNSEEMVDAEPTTVNDDSKTSSDGVSGEIGEDTIVVDTQRQPNPPITEGTSNEPRRSGREKRLPARYAMDSVHASLAISHEPQDFAKAMRRPDSRQ
jgi:hypothetical protein